MTPRPESRAVFERRLRELVPNSDIDLGVSDPRSNAAIAGAGGLVTGFILGWFRGRRGRRRS